MRNTGIINTKEVANRNKNFQSCILLQCHVPAGNMIIWFSDFRRSAIPQKQFDSSCHAEYETYRPNQKVRFRLNRQLFECEHKEYSNIRILET